MSKRLICLLLALLTLLSCPLLAGAEGETAPDQFYIFVDGQEVADAHVILENGVTYVSAYNVARALVPDTTVTWESELVLTGTGYTLSASPARSYIVCNGRYLYAPGQVKLHPDNGDLLLPVRLLARALGAPLGWDSYGVYLSTGGAPLESGESFYDADTLDVLARVVRHESGNQPLEGQIAVAAIILRRAQDGGITARQAVNAPGQFPGALNADPEARHYIAAKLAMDGADTVPGAYWFNGVGKPCWASRNKRLLYTIGGHAFYG